MDHDDLNELIQTTLAPIGFHAEEGEEFRTPRLDIHRYWHRPIRLSRLPIVGSGRAVVALVGEPADAPLSGAIEPLLDRLAAAAHSRFPPWPQGSGLSLGLTAIVLAKQPIHHEAEAALDRALSTLRPGRSRVVYLGVIVLNLDQGSMAQSFAVAVPDIFPEPRALAERLAPSFGRFLGRLPDAL